MKRIAWGIVVGGAVAAAYAGSAAATADPASWTPDYDVAGAQLNAAMSFPGPWSPVWELPASFTSSTGTTLTGTDYLTTAPGGFNDDFVTNTGATYDQDQLLPGFTNLYYDPSADGTAVDVMKTPFGNIDLSAMASTFAPVDFETTSPATTVGHNIVVTDDATYNIGEAIGLSDKEGGAWIGGLTDGAAITVLQTPDSSLVWAAPAAYSGGTGADATTLTGTLYVTSPRDVEFVDKAGDVFDERTLVSGLFPMENLYYDPVGGPAQDYLQTIFGNVDISPIASWLAPTEVSDLTSPSLLPDLSDAGLYSALDLGLPS